MSILRIAALYDTLGAVMPSPVVELNRAVAHGMVFGPQAGLRFVAEIARAAALRNYAPLPAAMGISCSGPAGWRKRGTTSSARPA